MIAFFLLAALVFVHDCSGATNCNKATVSLETVEDHFPKNDDPIGKMPELIDEMAKQHKVLVFYSEICAHCRDAIAIFNNKSIPVDCYDWQGEPRGLWVMNAALTKTKTTAPPTIFICGQYIGGFDELDKMAKSGSLQVNC